MRDQAIFCPRCGEKADEQQASGDGQNLGGNKEQEREQQDTYQQSTYQQSTYQQGYYTSTDMYDHTGEFTKKDISENKVLVMLAYLTGTLGLVVALLAGKESPYMAFHVRQILKFQVLKILTGIIALFLVFTIIVPLAAMIFLFILWICKIIAFFSVCGGKAKEPPIVRSFGFLK